MRHHHQIVRALILSSLMAPVLVNTAASKSVVELEGNDLAVYDSLRQAEVDPGGYFEVRPGSIWSTPLGTCRFESGELAFFVPVVGRPSGCLFIGKAQYEYRPDSPIERTQLARYCGDTIIATEMTSAYIRFFDTASACGLFACADTIVVEAPKGNSSIRACEKGVLQALTLDLGAQGWERLTDQGANLPWLYFCPRLKDQDRLHFILDDSQLEAVTVWRKPSGVAETGIVDLICSYDRERPPGAEAVHKELLYDGIDINRYDSRVVISGSGEMDLDVRLTTTARHTGQAVVSLSMAPDLDVDSVACDGVTAPIIYNEDGGWLLARAPHPLTAGDTLMIRLWYRGKKLLEKLPWGAFYIHNTTLWLPRAAPRRRTMYETEFEFPKYYELVSVGEQIAGTTIGDLRVTRWRTYRPESFISFNYGSFELLTEQIEGGPELRIYRGKNHLDGIFSGDFKKTVAENISGAVQLFSKIFCPYPWDHLSATEIPGGHGQGFPQLLHLAWVSFQSEEKGVTDAFRAHEVAHQWFGHIVGWKTYHDQWLSEGFADYAGALYLQMRYPGNKEFFQELREWRNQILQKGGHDFWHEGPDVAPIWLGFRCSSYKSPASYHYLVYAKGAYVLHMLRMMLFDYERQSDDRFFAMMNDYVTRYSGLDASTEDFQRIVQQHLHQDMQWFFDQWVYGTQIPRFEYQWDRTQQSDGQWVVKGSIAQFDTSPPFRVFMPISIEFEGGKQTFLQEIKEAVTEFTSPPLPGEPKGVEFDDYLTVLCREKVVHKP